MYTKFSIPIYSGTKLSTEERVRDTIGSCTSLLQLYSSTTTSTKFSTDTVASTKFSSCKAVASVVL
jgi:hypothetical protein